jgi:hypothetical protein
LDGDDTDNALLLNELQLVGFVGYSYRAAPVPGRAAFRWLLAIKDQSDWDICLENVTGHLKPPAYPRLPGADWDLLAKMEFPFNLEVKGELRRYALTAQLPDMDAVSEGKTFHFACHCPDGALLGVGPGYIAESADHGLTWRRIAVPGAEGMRFHKAFKTASGKYIAAAANADGTCEGLYLLSSRGELLRKQTPPPLYAWHGQHAIAQRDSVLMFADYAPHGGGGNIFKSVDDGLSWNCVMNRTDIMHFHFLVADPEQKGGWWCGSGDFPQQCHLFFSPNDGEDWYDKTDGLIDSVRIHHPRLFTTMEDRPGSFLRTTDVKFTSRGLIWGTDDDLGGRSSLLSMPDRFACSDMHVLAEIGPLIRNIVQHEDIYLLFTEGFEVSKHRGSADRLSPEIWAFTLDPFNITKVAHVPAYSLKPKFTQSTASPRTVGGVFYSLRGGEVVFGGNTRQQVLRWDIVQY